MKSKIFTHTIAIAAIFVYSSCSEQQQDVNGSVFDVLSPSKYNELQQKYTKFEDFEFGTSRVQSNSYWGLINTKGKEILKAEFDSIYPLEHNYRLIKKDSKYGLVNKQGKIIIPCKYEDFMRYLGNGLFAFCSNGKWGFVSDKDEIKIQFKYDKFQQITDSVFVGEINGKMGLFDYENNAIIDLEYDKIIYRPYPHSKVSYAQKGDRYAIINSKNEIVTECEYPYNMPYGDYITMKSFRHNRFCLIRWETGEVLIPYGYEELGDYIDGILYACKDKKYGYINPNNETIIPFKFADANNFSEGLAMVGIQKGYHTTWWGRLPKIVYGFIDKSGSFVIEPTFADQSLSSSNGFKEGLAVMGAERSDNVYPDKFGYIDKTGKWVIEPIYTEADDFKNGVAVIKTNNGYGAINKLGEIIVEPKYNEYDFRDWHNDKLVFKDEDGKTFEYSLSGVAL